MEQEDKKVKKSEKKDFEKEYSESSQFLVLMQTTLDMNGIKKVTILKNLIFMKFILHQY